MIILSKVCPRNVKRVVPYLFDLTPLIQMLLRYFEREISKLAKEYWICNLILSEC